jgi:hypothetical protein
LSAEQDTQASMATKFYQLGVKLEKFGMQLLKALQKLAVWYAD